MDNLTPDGRVSQLFSDVLGGSGAEPIATKAAALDGKPANDVGETGTDEGVGFLQAIDAAGRHNLVAMDPASGAVTGRTFEPGDWPAIRGWIEAHTGRRNCYVSVNEPAAGAPHDKLKKTDIAAIRCLCVDLDPPGSAPLDDERRDIARIADALQINAVPPTITIDSGGGSQAFWVLEEKLDPATHKEWAEDQGRGLARMVGGDAVQNIDRIMRLPGTLNIPDAKKLAKGRVERVARVTHRTDRTYSAEELSAVVKPVGGSAADPATVEQAHLKGDTDLIRRALEALPNTIALFPHRADMIRVGMAVHAACADDPGAGREMLHAWASKWEGDDYDYEKVEKAWSSFRGPHSVGAQWLYDKARMHGGEAGQAVYTSACVAKWFDPSVAESAPLFPEERTQASETWSGTYDVLSIGDLFNRPDPRFTIARHIPEQSLGFLYGDPGAGKSFIALDWALHLAFSRQSWHGDAIEGVDGASVIYLAGEGASGLKTRVRAWMKQHGVPESQQGRFGLIPQSVNFMEAEQVAKLARTLREKFAGRVVLVVVDTVSRSMPGADENLQKEMTLFVGACDRLKQEFGSTVLGVHHANKKGDMRGSSVLLGAGDFVFKLERPKDRMVGKLHCEKQKDAPDGWSDSYRLDCVHVEEGVASLVPSRCEDIVGPSITLTPELSERILAAMEAAWADGNPWGRHHQSKERQASRHMRVEFGLDPSAAEELVSMWLDTGRIVEDVVSAKNKKKGLRVVRDEARTVFD